MPSARFTTTAATVIGTTKAPVKTAAGVKGYATPLTWGLSETQGADIASVAGVTDIGAATGPYIHITGTEAITGLGTCTAGQRRTVKFTGACTLTHNATSLILPGGANITTAANDTAEFCSLGSGNWVCLWYKRQAETPYVEGSWTPVLTFVTPGDVSVTYSFQLGRYKKIGNLVVCFFNVTTSAFTHTTASGNLQVTGLPFAEIALAGLAPGGSLTGWQGITKANYTQIMPSINSGGSLVEFFASGSGQTGAVLNAGDVPTGGSVILRGTVIYMTA